MSRQAPRQSWADPTPDELLDPCSSPSLRNGTGRRTSPAVHWRRARSKEAAGLSGRFRDRPRLASPLPWKTLEPAVLPVLITPVAFFVCIISHCRLSIVCSSRLLLAQDGSGKSFVYSMCGPYLQGCGNKLRVLVGAQWELPAAVARRHQRHVFGFFPIPAPKTGILSGQRFRFEFSAFSSKVSPE